MSASEIEAFLTAVEAVVGTLAGTAVLDVRSDNRIWIRVSIDAFGTVLTEYEVSGDSGGLLPRGWYAGGAYACGHRQYFKQFPPREAVRE